MEALKRKQVLHTKHAFLKPPSRYPLNRRLGEPQSRSVEKGKVFILHALELRFLGLYTGCFIPAPLVRVNGSGI
jgi:hypothetical protein